MGGVSKQLQKLNEMEGVGEEMGDVKAARVARALAYDKSSRDARKWDAQVKHLTPFDIQDLVLPLCQPFSLCSSYHHDFPNKL